MYLYKTDDFFIIETAVQEIAKKSLRVDVDGNDLVIRRKSSRLSPITKGERSADELRCFRSRQNGEETTLVPKFENGLLRVAIKIRKRAFR